MPVRIEPVRVAHIVGVPVVITVTAGVFGCGALRTDGRDYGAGPGMLSIRPGASGGPDCRSPENSLPLLIAGVWTLQQRFRAAHPENLRRGKHTLPVPLAPGKINDQPHAFRLCYGVHGNTCQAARTQRPRWPALTDLRRPG